MMNELNQKILLLIESDNYRQMLANEALSIRDYTEIIMCARADIHCKLSLLKELAGAESDEYLEFAMSLTQQAIAAMTETEDTTVFMLTERWRDLDDGFLQIKEGSECFHTFRQAVEYLTDPDYLADEESESWNIITRYDLVDGELRESVRYFLNGRAVVWKYEFNDDNCDFYRHRFERNICNEISLPLCYSEGDIIRIDCHPFEEVRYALVLEKSSFGEAWCLLRDSWDYRVNEYYIVRNLDNIDMCLSFEGISPVYRFEIMEGEILGEDSVLKEMQKFIRETPEGLARVNNYLECKGEVSAEELRTALLKQEGIC